MKNFTINAKYNTIRIKLFVISFWLIVWQIMSVAIAQEILLVSPVCVIAKIFQLIQTISFWKAIFFSFSKIFIGFILAIFVGVLLAVFSYKHFIFKELIYPIIIAIKSAPVASFIILALIWIHSKDLSLFIAFLMALPIVYTNIYTGIITTNKKLLEMCMVFNVKPIKKIAYIYIPNITPYFISACSLAIGLSWKAGIAAEIIGLPKGSIGENLYTAKIFLETDTLFAWTVIIIIISMLFEKTMLHFIKYIQIKH
jgi:NitT/TauT family transport system permease protein